jgi:hypothetical protein
LGKDTLREGKHRGLPGVPAHKFMGRYNPHGPDHGPGFMQQYTDAIRRFTLQDNGTKISVHFLPEIKDTAHLHRRDFNVVPQVMPNGEQGLTAFSGYSAVMLICLTGTV